MSEFILPIILLALSFCLKLYINREVNKPSMLSAISELPVDVMFVSMAFIISYTIRFSNHIIETYNDGNKVLEKMDLNAGYSLFGSYIIITILIIAFWRTSIKKMDTQKWVAYGIFVGLNYIICIVALLFAFTKLYEVL
ncbi:hypothetical protein [Bacillus infantis]|uniref:hypothetical protein n=1 Tax=Bacillus infantis TaxID=324767 RepID=UPI003CF40A24